MIGQMTERSEALRGEAPRALLVEGVLNPINCVLSPINCPEILVAMCPTIGNNSSGEHKKDRGLAKRYA